MRRSLATAIAVFTSALLFGCAASQGGHSMDAGDHAMAADAGARTDVIYYCDCGPQCDCNSVSTQPGNCKCGKPMKWGHVVKVEGSDALVCTCAEGCKCAIDAKDPTKCGCGQPLKRVSLKGTGLYFCNCGGSCTCNVVSAQPGDCKCGMKLKRVD